MIHYVENKQMVVEDLLPLYQSVGWSNYTDYPERLEQAFQNSLYTVAAYDNDCLVGLLRAVGDGVSVLFIQDLLVLPNYQRQGIGRKLLQTTLEDQSDKTLSFYQGLGFRKLSDSNCTGLIYVG